MTRPDNFKYLWLPLACGGARDVSLQGHGGDSVSQQAAKGLDGLAEGSVADGGPA